MGSLDAHGGPPAGSIPYGCSAARAPATAPAPALLPSSTIETQLPNQAGNYIQSSVDGPHRKKVWIFGAYFSRESAVANNIAGDDPVTYLRIGLNLMDAVLRREGSRPPGRGGRAAVAKTWVSSTATAITIVACGHAIDHSGVRKEKKALEECRIMSRSRARDAVREAPPGIRVVHHTEPPLSFITQQPRPTKSCGVNVGHIISAR